MNRKNIGTKVFLGGTCNGSSWRDTLITNLKISYFNPVVPDWTPEAYEEELRQRECCDFLLYVLTSQMTGVYSIAEVVDDSNKRPGKTILCILEDGFNPSQIKSLKAVSKMVSNNGAKVFTSLKEVEDYLNG